MNDGSYSDRAYVDSVLDSLITTKAQVPPLWHIELISVLRQAENHKKITPAETSEFLAAINTLPIITQHMAVDLARENILTVARLYELSGYDACYLEMAIRQGLPLATLDKDLQKAASKAGVAVFLGQ